jgi:hypothetical protein
MLYHHHHIVIINDENDDGSLCECVFSTSSYGTDSHEKTAVALSVQESQKRLRTLGEEGHAGWQNGQHSECFK